MTVLDFNVKSVFELTRDVKNPRPDRRQKHDWRAAVEWKKGMRFKTLSRYICEGTSLPAIYSGKYTHEDILIRSAPMQLLQALTEVEPTLDELLEINLLNGYKHDAIELLIKDGVITKQQILDAAKRAEDGDNA